MHEVRRSAIGVIESQRKSGGYDEHQLDAVPCRCHRCGGTALVTNSNTVPPWVCADCLKKEPRA